MDTDKRTGALPAKERQALLEELRVCARGREWQKALEVANFRFYQGEDFLLDDQEYFLRFVSTGGVDIAVQVDECYINFVQFLGRGATTDVQHAERYVKNMLNCLAYTEFLCRIYPDDIPILHCTANVNYDLLNAGGLTLFNAAKKMGDEYFVDKATYLRRAGYTHTRDLYLHLQELNPMDTKARQRLKKMFQT